MKKFTLICFIFLLYTKQQTANEIIKVNLEELKEDLYGIIQREENNLKHLQTSYERFTQYYEKNTEDIEYDGELVRNQEIVEDTLINLKLKLHNSDRVNESASCISEALGDLIEMHEKFKSDYEQCRKSADASYKRYSRDFLAFKKASKRLVKRIEKIFKVCSFTDNENSLCKRQNLPIEELSVLANHTYVDEGQHIKSTDEILQNLRDCNAKAITPVSELAVDFNKNIDEECDFTL